jgi:hypothetical protein
MKMAFGWRVLRARLTLRFEGNYIELTWSCR